MRLIIRDNAEQVSEYVATYIKEKINRFQPTSSKPFVLGKFCVKYNKMQGLPTGSSPIGTYKKLIEFYKKGKDQKYYYSDIDKENSLSLMLLLSIWYIISDFLLLILKKDEYVNLPEDHPESYHSFMWTNLFSHVDIKRENVHILNGNAANMEEECANYEKQIVKAGGIELFLGGVGTDGHIAFNEPGSSLTSRTRTVSLAYETILSNSRFFGGVDNVPKVAVTVGVQTIMDAREVLIIVTGAHKALALHNAIEKGVNHMCTLSAIQMHPKAVVVCDEDATNELRVKTVKYFKGLP